VPKENLTALRVLKAPLPAKPNQLELWDSGCPGMMLKVSFGGARTFFAVHYVGGKARMHKLGRFPILSLDDARKAARKFLADPEAASKQQAAKETFEQVLDKFVLRHIKAKGLRSAKDYEARLRRHCAIWYARPFEEIRRRDVVALLDEVEDDVSASAADLLLAHISKLCNWYAGRSDDYQTPIVRGMKRGKAGSRKRKLNDDEIRALWKLTGDLGCYGAIVRMLLLTAQRRAKIANMKWTDLSSDGIWTIATAPREKGNPGILALPEAALEIIRARRRVTNSPYVFSNGEYAFNMWSAHKEALDLELTIPKWVLHDLRRTARSLMSRAGVQSEHAERVLGHVVGTPIEGVYDQHEYTAEKAAALVKLANLVNSIVNPPADNIVSFHAQALPL
jgi:integrase